MSSRSRRLAHRRRRLSSLTTGDGAVGSAAGLAATGASAGAAAAAAASAAPWRARPLMPKPRFGVRRALTLSWVTRILASRIDFAAARRYGGTVGGRTLKVVPC